MSAHKHMPPAPGPHMFHSAHPLVAVHIHSATLVPFDFAPPCTDWTPGFGWRPTTTGAALVQSAGGPTPDGSDTPGMHLILWFFANLCVHESLLHAVGSDGGGSDGGGFLSMLGRSVLVTKVAVAAQSAGAAAASLGGGTFASLPPAFVRLPPSSNEGGVEEPTSDEGVGGAVSRPAAVEVRQLLLLLSAVLSTLSFRAGSGSAAPWPWLAVVER